MACPKQKLSPVVLSQWLTKKLKCSITAPFLFSAPWAFLLLFCLILIVLSNRSVYAHQPVTIHLSIPTISKKVEQLAFLPKNSLNWVQNPYISANNQETKTPLSPAPSIPEETTPAILEPGLNSPLSVDASTNQPDYMSYTPYNTFPRELDLWDLEGKRLIQSIPVVSPDKSMMVYSEVMFVASNRQTYSKVYWVQIPPVMTGSTTSPNAYRVSQTETEATQSDVSIYQDRFNTTKTLQQRKVLASTGTNQTQKFDFKTLTVIDWSVSGKRLLMKERSGILHLGLRTSNVLVFDTTTGLVSIYPEIHRVIANYWKSKQNLKNLPEMSFDIQPLGWAPSSDEEILLKGWVYDREEKKFLGVWQYNISEHRTQLLQLDDYPVSVAANGWIATPVELPVIPPKKKSLWKKIKSRF